MAKVYCVARSRIRFRTRCGLDARAVPSVDGAIARDPYFWRPDSAFMRLIPGIEPAICVLCAAIRPRED